jgi:hypothetical protein
MDAMQFTSSDVLKLLTLCGAVIAHYFFIRNIIDGLKKDQTNGQQDIDKLDKEIAILDKIVRRIENDVTRIDQCVGFLKKQVDRIIK